MSTVIDLSQLPVPTVVETLDYETIRTALINRLTTELPNYTVVESDPAVKVIEIAAYRELNLRQRINEAAEAVMVASARGADLDNLAVFFNITRQAGETDDRFRRRIQLTFESYTAAGTAGAYEWHALDASSAVADVTALRTDPGKVDVVVMGATDPVPDAELAKVRARMQSDDVAPLTDQVTVRNARIRSVDVSADLILYIGPDADTVKQQAVTSVRAYGKRIRGFGYDVTVSGLIGALQVSGVQDVTVHNPAANVVVAPDEVARINAINLTATERAT